MVQPESLKTAGTLVAKEGHALLAGGTYLVSEKPAAVHTLVKIDTLLNAGIETTKVGLEIGAATTLQQLVDELGEGNWAKLAESATASCPSRQLRNRRTIGGEVARGRANSELYLVLMALNTELDLAGDGEDPVSIRKWDGNSVITDIRLKALPFGFQRFALLPSAPAFVAVAAANRDNALDIAVGGKADEVHTGTLGLPVNEADLSAFAVEAASIFTEDHYGTVDYKRHLIQVAVNRIGSEL